MAHLQKLGGYAKILVTLTAMEWSKRIKLLHLFVIKGQRERALRCFAKFSCAPPTEGSWREATEGRQNVCFNFSMSPSIFNGAGVKNYSCYGKPQQE